MISKGRENEYKKKMIRQLVDSNKRFRLNDAFVFSHFHSICNLTLKELNDVCKDEFYVNGHKLKKMNSCGLYVRKFIKKNSLEYNVKKLCSYPFKSVWRFKYTFRGSDFKKWGIFE